MKFTVTEEILKLFENEKVTINNIKKYIPNYLEYANSNIGYKGIKYLGAASNELNDFFTKNHYLSAQDFLNNIQSILEFHKIGVDETYKIYNFDFSDLPDGYGLKISEAEEYEYLESHISVLQRISEDIKQAKKNNKNNVITDEVLEQIANDPKLMLKLKELKEMK